VFSALLLTSATRPVNSNKFVETKKGLTWWERVSPDETCIRVRERCVWAFYGAKSVVENHCDPYKAFQDFCPDICQEGFLGNKGRLSDES
jgi:hypothetical protein